jgi:hypothetical protein
MPAACEEFTADELAYTLAEHRSHADDLLSFALTLQSKLPGIGPIDPKPKANTSDCYRSQVRADPARRAWRTSSVDALVSHVRAFPESGAAPPGWRSPVGVASFVSFDCGLA